MNSSLKLFPHLLIVSGVLLAASARAQVTAITSDYVDGDTRNLTSITIGGTQYFQSDITLGQLDVDTASQTGALIGRLVGGSSAPGASDANINNAGSTFNFSYTPLNLGAGSVYQFGRVIEEDDSIFILEWEAAEETTQTLGLVNSSGDLIEGYSYSFDIDTAFSGELYNHPGGMAFNGGSSGIAANVDSLAGLSISLSDFTGTEVGDLSTATGILIVNSASLDAPMIGLASIPEPGSFALILGFVSVGFLSTRRLSRAM
ncbi:hypothetical protein SH580_00240 [Coraliomargarita algicola]|uniref:PEP-CTERM protein-sorting domain-containing protein n=1 Tax=Coraliomargarita algicola TaxID=3092156 RepID=A0ABZ0RMI1_9BACT|nr:hypothetical protein [Coraliomargarita sp. J2-16]WPJ96127.1 hypothetical protein SH580_00240 [Coraliomargarita sp. J2-16]